jgi:hypothetical protein
MSAAYKEFSGLNLPAFEAEILANGRRNRLLKKVFRFVKVPHLLYFTKGRPAPMVCPVFTTLFHVLSKTWYADTKP